MSVLAVSETSETVSLKILSDTSAASCGHRVITYELDGVQKTLHATNGELAEPADEAAVVLGFVRLRRARGKSEVGTRIA